MKRLFGHLTTKYGYIDYVGCWFLRAADYCRQTGASSALVATNSVCQGRQLPQLWPLVLRHDVEIFYAHHSFKWTNNAARNAGVTCVIIALAMKGVRTRKTIFDGDFSRAAANINAYLIDGADIFVTSVPRPLAQLPVMLTGSVPNDGGHLILGPAEVRSLTSLHAETRKFIRPFFGSQDYLQGFVRSCLMIGDRDLELARSIPEIRTRLKLVASLRAESDKRETREQLADIPHVFQHHAPIPSRHAIIIPSVSSERREWFPVGLVPARTVVSNLAFLISDSEVWPLGVLLSRLHLVWLATVCGKLKTDFRYSNTLGWNTFPVPPLTEKNKTDLTRCADDILLAREAHFPATVADLYDPEAMPADLRAAHDRNDEVMERIYIGRRFRNDTERLEKLFDLYTKVTHGGRRTTRRLKKGI